MVRRAQVSGKGRLLIGLSQILRHYRNLRLGSVFGKTRSLSDNQGPRNALQWSNVSPWFRFSFHQCGPPAQTVQRGTSLALLQLFLSSTSWFIVLLRFCWYWTSLCLWPSTGSQRPVVSHRFYRLALSEWHEKLEFQCLQDAFCIARTTIVVEFMVQVSEYVQQYIQPFYPLVVFSNEESAAVKISKARTWCQYNSKALKACLRTLSLIIAQRSWRISNASVGPSG